MLVYRRRSDQDSRGIWLLSVRALVLTVVLTTDWGVVGNPIRFDVLHSLYLAFAVLVVGSYVLYRRSGFRRVFYLCLIVEFVLELLLANTIVMTSGGVYSPFFALYLLTIVSAALGFRLVGTLMIATAAAAAYIAAVNAITDPLWILRDPNFWKQVIQNTDERSFSIFVRVCMFYLLAFISGFLAERLKQRDEDLASTSRALRDARLETGDILKHLHSGLLTIDIHGAVTYFNQAAQDILQVGIEEVRGKTIQQAFGSRFPQLAERLRAACQSMRGSTRGEISIEPRPGHHVPLGISTSIMGNEGNRRGVIAIFQDITDAKQLEERLRLKDRMAAIGELAAGIAHEIRNPLAAICGSVEVLQNELSVEGENKNLLELIIKESSRLNEIITEFLFYSRIQPTATKRVRLAPVIQEVLELVRRRPDYHQEIILQSRLADSEVLVEADEDLLKQLFLNVMINSVEAIGDQRGMITISARRARHDELPERLPDGQTKNSEDLAAAPWIRVTVSDNGPGIPDDVRDKIWQPFFSTKKIGTGLGLAIVSRLVEHLDGQLDLQSTVNQGTNLHVFLKRHRSKTAPIRLVDQASVT